MYYIKSTKTVENAENYFQTKDISGIGYAENDDKVVYCDNLFERIGTIVLSKNNELSYCHYKNYNASDWASYKKEGIIVIPKEHMSDGRDRMIPLSGVTSTAGTAGSYTTMQWGPTGSTALSKQYTRVPSWTNEPGGTVGSTSWGYVPSDKFSGITEESILGSGYTLVSGQTKMYSKGSGDNITYLYWGGRYANDESVAYDIRTSGTSAGTVYSTLPSPYGYMGSVNSDFRNDPGNGNNAFLDINGSGNTDVLYSLGSGYSAATACHNFTNGGSGMFSSPGDWYLPAFGELAFIVPRYLLINRAISAAGGVQLPSTNFWSSSEFSGTYSWYVRTNIGTVGDYTKTVGVYVLPFRAL